MMDLRTTYSTSLGDDPHAELIQSILGDIQCQNPSTQETRINEIKRQTVAHILPLLGMSANFLYCILTCYQPNIIFHIDRSKMPLE